MRSIQVTNKAMVIDFSIAVGYFKDARLFNSVHVVRDQAFS
jgi:hypothetical protein